MKMRKPSAALVKLFDEILPNDPRVERRQMFGHPAAFAGGNMFAGLFEESCILKLGEADREEIRGKHGATKFAPMGREMREYSVVPEKLLADRKAVSGWLTRGMTYALALPPKPKKAKKSAKKAAPRKK